MKISELIAITEAERILFNTDSSGHYEDSEITALIFDSRNVVAGAAFFAIPGNLKNGADYTREVLLAGASLILYQEGEPIPENLCEQLDDLHALLVSVKDIRFALAHASHVFYEKPSSRTVVCGITGTNGKTSSAWLLSQIASGLKKPALYLGTLGAFAFKEESIEVRQEEGRTTLDPVSINKILREAELDGVKFSALEVTSHGLDQKRTASIDWDVAAFSNITQDHLDYHITFEAYKKAKSLLFFNGLVSSKKETRVAVINIDDNYGAELAFKIAKEIPEISLLTVSELDAGADLYLASCALFDGGSALRMIYRTEEYCCSTNLIGAFNITNLLLAAACAIASGFSLPGILPTLKSLVPVPGRLQLVSTEPIKVFVDYAHTPDALDKVQNVIKTLLRDENTGNKLGRLITVFGCGGDRDKSKRPLMGASVAGLSDIGIITSDNPRTEDPSVIINDIEAGMLEIVSPDFFTFECQPDRRLAIRRALEISEAGDILLIAGKGHEPYQEINGIKYPFDDRVVVLEEINNLEKR